LSSGVKPQKVLWQLNIEYSNFKGA